MLASVLLAARPPRGNDHETLGCLAPGRRIGAFAAGWRWRRIPRGQGAERAARDLRGAPQRTGPLQLERRAAADRGRHQDRANYYEFGRRDPEDTADAFFASKANRARLEYMLRHGRISPATNNEIVNHTPLIGVKVYETFIDVDVYR